jgi:hypothetical protein
LLAREAFFNFFLKRFVFVFRWFSVVENIPTEQHVLCRNCIDSLGFSFVVICFFFLPFMHFLVCIRLIRAARRRTRLLIVCGGGGGGGSSSSRGVTAEYSSSPSQR